MRASAASSAAVSAWRGSLQQPAHLREPGRLRRRFRHALRVAARRRRSPGDQRQYRRDGPLPVLQRRRYLDGELARPGVGDAVPVAQPARRHHLQLRGSGAAAAAAASAPAAAASAAASAASAAASPAGDSGSLHRLLRLGQGRDHPAGRGDPGQCGGCLSVDRPGAGRACRSRRPFGLRPTTTSACRSGAPTTSASYLAGRGVPDGSITTEAFGESRPLVDTADGVREPQNRRVEITFGPGSGW